jgi:predicted transcriptional regulator
MNAGESKIEWIIKAFETYPEFTFSDVARQWKNTYWEMTPQGVSSLMERNHFKPRSIIRLRKLLRESIEKMQQEEKLIDNLVTLGVTHFTRKDIDVDRLRELYAAGHGIAFIAKELDISVSAVKNRLKKLGIYRSDPTNAWKHRNEYINPRVVKWDYDQGMSVEALTKKYNRSIATIYKMIKDS